MVAPAERAWENADGARVFLATPHPPLDGETPAGRVSTGPGAWRVEVLPRRLEEGLPV